MALKVSIPVGVIVAKKKVDHPWIDWSWRPVAVLPGAAPVEDWVEIQSGEGWTHYHCATLPLTLYRGETEAYLVNLSDTPPKVYVVLRRDNEGGADRPYFVEMVTASPYEAGDFLAPGEDIVEPVPMPPGLVAWTQAFIDEHHVEREFKKRRRDKADPEATKFGKEPIFSNPRGRRFDTESEN